MKKDLPAKRLQTIKPFQVMDILATAKRMQAEGKDVVHLEIGEPDFSSPGTIIKAGVDSMKAGNTHYTPALGIPELRSAIADYYTRQYQVDVSVERIAVTTGASGALLLLFAMLLDPEDEVLMSDPGYPCYRHFASLFNSFPICLPVSANTDFQLSASMIEKAWSERTKVVILATPSNPTGTMLAPDEIKEIVTIVNQRGGIVIVDEIYQGLVYGQAPATALAISEDLVVINSFSKYFGMTGWRLGWSVLPEALIQHIDKLAQNFYLSPPTGSQYAALAAFQDNTIKELERRRKELQRRRDYLIPELQDLGFEIPAIPQGAFYIYTDCSAFTEDSEQFAADLLEKAHVAIAPGSDFGKHEAKRYVRIAYTQPIERLQEAIQRIKKYLNENLI